MDSTPTPVNSTGMSLPPLLPAPTNPNQVNLNIVNSTNASNNNNTTTAVLTPEQEQEKQLKVKYPNPQRPGGSAFIQKILNRGNKKYFDSGDYNMAKSKKANIKTNSLIANNNNLNIDSGNMTAPSTPEIVISAQQQQQTPTSPSNTTLTNSSTPEQINTTITNISIIPTPNQTSPLSSNINIVNNTPNSSPMILSTSVSSSTLLNTHHQQTMMPSSISTQSINMLSASLSTEKMLDTDEIGHGIPTPECLPQSRKHSIVQSKLATPRLPSS